MRVLLCNKFYYKRGGDCVVLLNTEQLLKSKGHEVAVYSMQHPQNIQSVWSHYWPTTMSVTDAFIRPFGSRQVKDGFIRLLDDFLPDVVHLHNIHTQLSPVIAEIAHKRGIRVVWTLHDTKLVCPCYTCTRNSHWCEECFDDKTAVFRHRCMPGGLIGSLIGYKEIKKWNSHRLQQCVDLFLPPSQFMMDTMIRGGYDAQKFRVLYNFIDLSKVSMPCFEKQDYYVFLGRVNEEKGVRTLCKAAAMIDKRLIVIGGGDLLMELKHEYRNVKNIEFLGQCSWEELRPIVEGARFMVIPSECSENNPLSVIECLSLGTPVLGARIGGIPELIKENLNGMTFESGNVDDLKKKIVMMFNSSYDYHIIAQDANKRFSSATFYDKLLDMYRY